MYASTPCLTAAVRISGLRLHITRTISVRSRMANWSERYSIAFSCCGAESSTDRDDNDRITATIDMSCSRLVARHASCSARLRWIQSFSSSRTSFGGASLSFSIFSARFRSSLLSQPSTWDMILDRSARGTLDNSEVPLTAASSSCLRPLRYSSPSSS